MSKASSLLFLALLAASLAVYPMAGTWLLPALIVYAAVVIRWPHAWLFALPVLVPLLDLAPVTGWFFLEELDLFLMLTAAIGYWRMAPATHATFLHQGGPSGVQSSQDRSAVIPRQIQFAVVLVTLACVISCVRGLIPLAPLDANAFANYLSSYNALRLAKSWCWLVVLLPLLRHAAGPALERITTHLVPGMLCGLAVVALADLAERYYFPGLLNMSSDYRTSAPFSGMHTGGAALDGYLALTLPLLSCWFSQRQSALRTLAGLVLLALALYAALTTFSRGLYLGLAISGIILLLANAARITRHALALLAAGCFALWLAFATSGYRGLAAAALILLMTGQISSKALRWRRDWPVLLACAGFTMAMVHFAYRHAGYAGLQGMAGAVALALALLAIQLRAQRPLWMPQRRHGIAALSLLLAAGLIIPVAAGSYAGERWNRSASDLSARWQHWRSTLAMMDNARLDSLFGVGQGRFPREYYWHNIARERTASFAYVNDGDNLALRLTPPYYPRGYGELLRILQRISLSPASSYVFSVDVRHATAESFLAIHICERQMLYPQHCIKLPVRLKPSSGDAWQRYLVPFQSGRLDGASMLSVVPVQLEIALLGGKSRVDIDRVSIQHSGNQTELLRNGDFSNGSSYWFFSSDHHHLPWHVKNLLLSQYFDQGALGAFALILLIAVVGGRLAVRARKGEHLALVHLAALAGFLVVGQFDSLLDVPRIALLFYFYLLAASLQPGPPGMRPGS